MLLQSVRHLATQKLVHLDLACQKWGSRSRLIIEGKGGGVQISFEVPWGGYFSLGGTLVVHGGRIFVHGGPTFD